MTMKNAKMITQAAFNKLLTLYADNVKVNRTRLVDLVRHALTAYWTETNKDGSLRHNPARLGEVRKVVVQHTLPLELSFLDDMASRLLPHIWDNEKDGYNAVDQERYDAIVKDWSTRLDVSLEKGFYTPVVPEGNADGSTNGDSAPKPTMDVDKVVSRVKSIITSWKKTNPDKPFPTVDLYDAVVSKVKAVSLSSDNEKLEKRFKAAGDVEMQSLRSREMRSRHASKASESKASKADRSATTARRKVAALQEQVKALKDELRKAKRAIAKTKPVVKTLPVIEGNKPSECTAI